MPKVLAPAFTSARSIFGPGYRVYFGKEGELIIILLGGGTKQRQQNDIKRALERWEDYKLRKKQHKEKKQEE
jgi:putative addiction module killer protein